MGIYVIVNMVYEVTVYIEEGNLSNEQAISIHALYVSYSCRMY